MWNKIFSILLIATLAFSLSAQQSRRSRSRRDRSRTTQPAAVQSKQTPEKSSAQRDAKKQSVPSSPARTPAPGGDPKFDPKKTTLTQNQIDTVLNGQIRKKLLECKIPMKLHGHKDEEENAPENNETPEDGRKPEDGKKNDGGGKSEQFAFVSRLDFAIMMSQYKSLISNFELIEVSCIRPEWYQQYEAELRKFGPLINEMTIALRIQSHERYAACAKKFKTHQTACLKFLKGKPPRIGRDQYDALVLKNSKIRYQNYLKRLQAEREAAMKRRQEMLKQQNQQKLQSGKPAQAPAAKNPPCAGSRRFVSSAGAGKCASSSPAAAFSTTWSAS